MDAFDPATGHLVGQIRVWDPSTEPEVRESPRVIVSDDWTLNSVVQAEIHTLNGDGEFYCAVNRRVGRLGDLFYAILAITVTSFVTSPR